MRAAAWGGAAGLCLLQFALAYELHLGVTEPAALGWLGALLPVVLTASSFVLGAAAATRFEE